MSIIRMHKRDVPYVQIRKYCFEDRRLSWKARGLLGYLLSLPSDWKIYVADLVKRAPDGKTSVYSALNELQGAGYVKPVQIRDESGRFVAGGYDVFEEPEETFFAQNKDPEPENPSPDLPYSENQPLINKQVNKNTKTKKTQQQAVVAENPSLDNSSDDEDVQPPVAAADVKILSDRLLGEILTPAQVSAVNDTVSQLLAEQPELGDAKCLHDEITKTLLNPKSFSLAGNDFRRKLNTIRKTIRSGKWRPVTPDITKRVKRYEDALEETELELRFEQQERLHWQHKLTLIDRAKFPENYEVMSRQLLKAEARIEKLTEKLDALRQSQDNH
ncbi:MAG: hypothetical protein CMF50_03805 [Legionellales bacterium]|nr:hypothetical protein [Legionellales bacterium]